MTLLTQQKTSLRDTEVPLCVDLDGTLIQTDLLHESVFALLRKNILHGLQLPFWYLRGKAQLKDQVASRIQIDPTTLPYRQEVLSFLRTQKEQGRYLVLATASNLQLAGPIADYLQLFDEIIASDAEVNLKGEAKLQALKQRFEHTGFDYLGDSKADLPLWQAARKAYVVHPSSRLLRQARKICQPEQVFQAESNQLQAILKLIRPHQWAKNLLLFVPLVLAHQLTNVPSLLQVILAFAAFCCCASAVYILNDLLDVQADRNHPHKKHRSLASGRVSIPTAIGLFGMLLALGLTLGIMIFSAKFVGVLVLYMGLTTAYSFYLKRKPILDVFVLAGLYTLRILAGGAAAEVEVTGWLIAFSLFFFISLALVKRYSELARLQQEEGEDPGHRGYLIEDLGMIQSIGPASGYMAVLTMCLYINAQDVSRLYGEPKLLWGICFILFYWITRVWFMARRRQLNEDPVVFATTDPVSYISGLGILAILWFASA